VAGGLPDALCYPLAIICATASFVLVTRALRPKTGLRIDVTRLGQIRLVDTYPNAEAGFPRLSDAEGEVVQLGQGSTLWSSLMVLRLQPVCMLMHFMLCLLPVAGSLQDKIIAMCPAPTCRIG
jgi:hypothetical protein